VVSREDKVLVIKKTQEILAAKETLKKKQEEKRKEALKLTADLRKRKQELLDKQLTELRSLIERAEKNPDQKDAIMVTIKAMQQSIDSLRKDLALSNNGQSANATNKPLPKTREQAQREILDAELDLMTAQQEGQDSAELQKK
jgi:RNA-binding protein 26